MNQEKRGIEISPSIIEQVNEEPTKYWRCGVKLTTPWFWNGVTLGVGETERAAWIQREKALASGHYVSVGTPVASTREEVNAIAVEEDCTEVQVIDEAGSVVDSWRVA